MRQNALTLQAISDFTPFWNLGTDTLRNDSRAGNNGLSFPNFLLAPGEARFSNDWELCAAYYPSIPSKGDVSRF